MSDNKNPTDKKAAKLVGQDRLRAEALVRREPTDPQG